MNVYKIKEDRGDKDYSSVITIVTRKHILYKKREVDESSQRGTETKKSN